MYERIVVPLDGSELAERALPQAEQLARVTDAPLHLVRVVDFTKLEPYGAYGLAIEYAGMAQVLGQEQAEARAYLERVAQDLTDRGLRVSTEVRRGTAARELTGATRPGDLLVMATHGRGGMARWFLGSVAEEVARHATVPVLLVRAQPASTADPARQAAPNQTA